jgi:cytochrome b561
MLMGLLILIAGSTPTNGEKEEHTELTTFDWLNHSLPGTLSLILGIAILWSGGMLKGRFNKSKKFKPFRIHKTLTIILSLLLTITFFFGMRLTYQNDAVLMSSLHGYVGAAIIAITWTSLYLSPFIQKKESARKLHSKLGILMVMLLILQTILGFQNALG